MWAQSDNSNASVAPHPITQQVLKTRDHITQTHLQQVEKAMQLDYQRLKIQIQFAIEDCKQMLINDPNSACATKKISNMFAHDLVNRVISEMSTAEIGISLHIQTQLYLGLIQFSDILVVVRLIKDDNQK
jgi:hypothetical protein